MRCEMYDVGSRQTWGHCSCHGLLNLSLENSAAFDKVGGGLRSFSSFGRGGAKYVALCDHVAFVQQPDLALTNSPHACANACRRAH